MIHNKYYYVLKQYLGDYTLKIHGRSLIGKIPLSQKNIAITFGELEKKGILRHEKRGNIKLFEINPAYSEIKDVLQSTEIFRKIDFLSANRKLSHIFNSDDRIVGIFGSYANHTQTKTSDIDIFIVGKKTKEDYDLLGKKFDMNIELKYFEEDEFRQLAAQKNNLLKEIIKNHVIIFNAEKFVNMIWKDYYGFDKLVLKAKGRNQTN